MPAKLSSAFKYPMLANSNVSSMSASIRNEFYNANNMTEYYISPEDREKTSKIEKDYNDRIYEGSTQNYINDKNKSTKIINMSDYELIEQVLRSPNCMKLLKAIILSESPMFSPYSNYNYSLTFDDILKYIILFSSLALIVISLLK